MKEHKQYECDYCGFETDNYEECFSHEMDCECNPELKMCGSCKYATPITVYEVEYIKCGRLKHSYDTCEHWTDK